MKKCIVYILFLLVTVTLSAQEFYDFGFERDLSLPVFTSDSVLLRHAWAGGMNSVRFSEIDVNNDGVKDLFGFEKNGNRILIFVNQNIENQVSYIFSPQYVQRFPKLHDWAILKDYDGDGKEDIFTYGNAGITVYHNDSDASGLRFSLVTEQLESFYYNGYVNIYCSPDDYLAIEDIDGDGDLDILDFMVLGKYVHYQRNYAVENGLGIENFDYHLEDECWGHFAEGADDNSIVLDTECEDKKSDKNEPLRHVGSTILAYDFNGNGLKDILLGDVDYPQLILLENGGTPEDARMVSQTASFPNANKPIFLYSMPVASFLDVDNDGVDELLVSPSDPSLTKSQNINSVWLYHYDSLSRQFEFQSSSFLQENMIDVGGGAYPIFFDWDGDGLTDLFISNFGVWDSARLDNYFLSCHYSSSIAYFKNVGTINNPSFQLITNDFGNFKQYNLTSLYPAFADFDGDGFVDVLCGSSEKGLLLFLNLGEENFSAPVSYLNELQTTFATPQLFDVDNDGRLDLLLGNKRGTLSFYKNYSDDLFDFQFVTDEFGGVDVRDYQLSYFGFSVPFFFKDNEGKTKLFCGNEQGQIAYYKNIDENLDGAFTLVNSSLVETIDGKACEIREGTRTGLCASDLNNDGWLDMMVGNYAGGLAYFKGTSPLQVSNAVEKTGKMKFSVFPNPTADVIRVERLSSSEQVDYQLFDVNGRLLFAQKSSESVFTIDLSDWNDGFYFLRILSSNYSQTEKIIRSH
ncbi:MAG: T9SS type A sorting domain-containing protein [Bacteroidales bacterium]|nr:T9SS type A sorting domain-containing protein [Bacteroidales bacterium]